MVTNNAQGLTTLLSDLWFIRPFQCDYQKIRENKELYDKFLHEHCIAGDDEMSSDRNSDSDTDSEPVIMIKTEKFSDGEGEVEKKDTQE